MDRMQERTWFLKTDRIGFSKWKDTDMDLARSLWGDPQVTKYICASGKFSDEDVARRLALEMENDRNHQVQYWPFFELQTQRLIGCCGLRPYKDGMYEIGFHLRPEFWRQGYAKEAAQTVINFAFSVLNVPALFAGHNPDNIASAKRLSSLGFTYVGDEFYEPTGKMHPSYILKRSL